MLIKSLPKEGYEHYHISENGEVYSEYKAGILKKLKPKIDKRDGYHIYDLRHREFGRSRRLFVRVHQLVAWTFIGPQPEGMYVCHWDDNPTHNHYTNLRYGTPKMNAADRIRNRRERGI